MVTVLTRKHIRNDDQGRDVAIVFIAVASASELPAVDGINNTIIHEASGAWDISTGDTYAYIANTGWVKQPNGIPFHYFEEVWT